MRLRTVFVFLFFTYVFCAAGQSTDLWAELSKKYVEEPAVFVDRSEILNIVIEGDSLKAYSEFSENLMHLKDQTDQLSARKVYGSHFSQVSNLKARTMVWDKSKYRTMEVTSFKKNSDRAKGVFFDDSYYYAFDFPSVAAHNMTQLQYKEVIQDARFISGFMFSSYLPQAHASYTIKANKDVDLFFQVLNDPEHTITFTKTEKGKNVMYQWTQENIPAIQSDINSPSFRYFTPHVVCYVKSFQVKGKRHDVLSGVESLYEWYQTFLKNLNKENSSELIAIVDKLKKENQTEKELVSSIFYWVQDNIQYIAFEQGMRGLIPNSGSYTCEKRYGDCKDMANLMVNMLQLAGLKAHHTWIGTRDIPYKYSELPTPLVDNHMIATYISTDGMYYFLDATSNYTPLSFPSSMIQGKEALISIGPKAYEIREIPVMDKEKNVMTDSMFLQLKDNQITGVGRSSFIGYAKIFASYELDRSEDKKVKENVIKIIGKGSNKFLLDSYTINHIQEEEKSLLLNYTFRLPDYFQKAGNEIYINLNLNKDYYNTYINSDTRKSPMENEYKYTKYEYTELKIPDGYQLTFLPANASYAGDLIGCDITYRVAGDKVIVSKKTYLNYLLMDTSLFKQWNEEVKNISKIYKESIVITRK